MCLFNFVCYSVDRKILINYNTLPTSACGLCSSRLWLSVVIYILSHRHVIAEFSPTISSLNDGLQSEDESVVLESINARDYRINITKNQNGKPWHDERYITHCVRPAKCERLQNSTCFGSKIPYKFTSLALTDATSQADSRSQLHMFEALRNIPKCWAVIQVSNRTTHFFSRVCLDACDPIVPTLSHTHKIYVCHKVPFNTQIKMLIACLF